MNTLRETKERPLTVSMIWGGKEQFPYIRLLGRWVDAAGYRIGDKITVTLVDGSIVIRKNPTSNLNWSV